MIKKCFLKSAIKIISLTSDVFRLPSYVSLPKIYSSPMGYIFEAEIEQIMNAVSARTIGEAETIRLRDLLAADLHPAIKAYFKARVRQLLQQERMTEVRSKKFPYSLPEVAPPLGEVGGVLVSKHFF